jgi:hypothetical protein
MSLGSLISRGMRLGRSSYRKESAMSWPSTTAGQRHVVGGAHKDVIRTPGLHLAWKTFSNTSPPPIPSEI